MDARPTYTTYDPRREKMRSQSGAMRGGRPATSFLTPSVSRHAAVRDDDRDCARGQDLAPVHEEGWPARESHSSGRSGRAKGPREAALQAREPWRSAKVAELAESLDGGDPQVRALVLEGPRGTALRAVGDPADHMVASRAVVEMERSRLQQEQQHRAPHHNSRRNAVPRSSDIALAVPPGRGPANELAPRRPGSSGKEASFGAVYEYRDSAGTSKVVASTSTMPERQFLLDRRQYDNVLAGAPEPSLVWAGISGGPGGLSEAQMTEVRRAVASARADRLNAQKLSDVKPYSKHG